MNITNLIFLVRIRLNKITSFARKKISSKFVQSWADYDSLAQKLMNEMDWPSMQKLCHEMSKQFPNQAAAYRWLGIAQEKSGDHDGQFSSYIRCIDLDANQPAWVYLVAAQLLIKKKKWHEAYRIIDVTLGLYPQNGEAYRWRGYCLEKVGDYVGQIFNYEKATEIEKQPAWVYLTLIRLYVESKDYIKAATLSYEIIREYEGTSTSGNAYVYLGDSFYEQNNLDAAIDSYRSALGLFASLPVNDKLDNALREKILIEEYKFLVEEFIELFNSGVTLENCYSFLELQPHRIEVISAIADYHFKANRLNAAIAFYMMIPENHHFSSHASLMLKNILTRQQSHKESLSLNCADRA
jgi:tetratricopeptide (TPR) repeat protein